MSLIAGFRNFSNPEENLAAEERFLSRFTLPYGKVRGSLLRKEGFSFIHRENACIAEEGKKVLLLEGFLTGEYREKDLLYLYKKYGWEKMIPLLEGSFLLVLWDGEKDSLFLAADPLGTKSLCYFSAGGEFAFAGSISLLKCHKKFPFEWDLQSFRDYLSFGFIPGENTQYKGVRKLRPGSTLSITFSRDKSCPFLLRKRYFKADFSRKILLPNEEFPVLCREKLSSATKSLVEKAESLTGKTPALFLSGGLDSAIISALALESRPEDFKGYSISFEDPAYDEGSLAAESGEFLKSRYGKRFHHKIIKLKGEELLPRLEKMAAFSALPYGDSSLLPTSHLCGKAAEEGETFALNGDGADELYGGYERYIAMELYRKWGKIPAILRRQLYSLFSRLPGSRGGDRGKMARLVRFLRCGTLSSRQEQYFQLTTHGGEKLKEEIMGELFRETAPTLDSFDPEMLLSSTPDSGEGPMALDLVHYLAWDTLPKAELSADSAGIFSTTPFLAKESLAFAQTLPFSMKIDSFRRKKILCDAFADKIVPGLATRKKRGFGVPVGAFFRNSWKEFLKENLLEGELTGKGLFRKEALEKLIREHQEGKRDHAYILYYLLILSLTLPERK